jgi:hypothetical protein
VEGNFAPNRFSLAMEIVEIDSLGAAEAAGRSTQGTFRKSISHQHWLSILENTHTHKQWEVAYVKSMGSILAKCIWE